MVWLSYIQAAEQEEEKKPGICKHQTIEAVLVLHSGPAYTGKEGKGILFFQVEGKAWSSAVLVQVNSQDTQHPSRNTVKNYLVVCWFFLP